METPRVIRSAAVSGARRLDVSVPDRKQPAPAPEIAAAARAQPAMSHSDAEPPVPIPGYSADLVESLRFQVKELEQQKAVLQRELDQLRQQHQFQSQSLAQDQATGFNKGYQAGVDEARLQTEMGLAELREAITLFKQGLKCQVTGMEGVAAEMTLAGLVKIVGDRYADEAFVLEATRHVAGQIRDNARVILRVNKRDQDILLRHVTELKELLGDAVEVVADTRVQTGGCLIEADTGMLDGRLETQIRNLQESIMTVVRESRPSP